MEKAIVYSIDGWNNFCRVFEIPKAYPQGFLFGGGKPVAFMMVDWFNPVSGIDQPAISKEKWLEEFGEIKTENVSLKELQDALIPFLKKKSYIKTGREYLVLCDFGAAIKFSA